MTKPKVFITPRFAALATFLNMPLINLLGKKFIVQITDLNISRHEYLEKVKGSFAIACHPKDGIDEELIAAAGSNLKAVCLVATGYESLDLKALKARRIRVGLAGKAFTDATAEHALALLLAASRKMAVFDHEYRRNPELVYNSKGSYLGLKSCTVGLVGAGRIGMSVARKLIPFDIGRLLYFCRSEKPEMKAYGGEFRPALKHLAKESDYIVVMVPYNEETDKIINKEILDVMKPTSVIVNVGRGGLIDQDALIDALRLKKIAGAALDVTTPEPLPTGHPLLELNNVLITPHIAGSTDTALKRGINMTLDSIIAVQEGREMPEELIL